MPDWNLPLKLYQANFIFGKLAGVVTVDVATKVASSQPGQISIEAEIDFLTGVYLYVRDSDETVVVEVRVGSDDCV